MSDKRESFLLLRMMALAAALFLLAGCQFNLAERIVPNYPSNLPAAGYFHWVSQATDEQKQQQLDTVQAATVDAQSTVNLVQRAILLYHMDITGEDTIADLNLDLATESACGNNQRCQDYASFAAVFSSLTQLTQQLQGSEQQVRNLQDRIRILNQQIEALTNIEQQLLEREQGQN